MQFYSLCFNAGFGGEMRIYDNFDEYIRVFAELTASISRPGFGIDTYKVSAMDKEEAYKKAKQYYMVNGWDSL